jgi:hypothetical protein
MDGGVYSGNVATGSALLGTAAMATLGDWTTRLTVGPATTGSEQSASKKMVAPELAGWKSRYRRLP